MSTSQGISYKVMEMVIKNRTNISCHHWNIFSLLGIINQDYFASRGCILIGGINSQLKLFFYLRTDFAEIW